MSIDLGTSLAGVRLPFCAMNAAGMYGTAAEMRALVASEAGAVVLRTATVHPFVHPGFRSLHNPGYDKLLALVRELAAAGDKPVVASIAGAGADEYVLLARAFAEAGAAIIEADLADPWVEATMAPFETAGLLRELLAPVVAAVAIPVAVKLPAGVRLPYGRIGEELCAARVRAVVIRNDFAGIEKFQLEVGGALDAVALGGIRSGYDVSRARAKGAAAVQVRTPLVGEGPAVFARLAREMRVARGERRRQDTPIR